MVKIIPMKYEFFNKKSEVLYKKLLQNDKKGMFKDYFDSINQKQSFYSSNGIPDNCLLSLSAFQVIEFYLKYDKRQIRKIFYKFSKMAANKNKNKFKKLISQSNKIINEMSIDKYTMSSNTMIDFEFEINKKIIKSIKIFLDIIGTGVYRIGYNIHLQDEYYYKYWQIATYNFPNMLEIKKIPLLNKGNIVFHDGNFMKSNVLVKLQNEIVDDIYKIIKNIAPGLFISLYKSMPIIMVLETDIITYYTTYRSFISILFLIKLQKSHIP
jgi:hypothetical protein